MIPLFLTESNWNDYGNDELVEKKKMLLNELESFLWSLMSEAGRSEVRLWLCKTIACISSISHRHHCQLFLKLLRAKPLKRDMTVQLLRLLFEKKPRKAGNVLAKKSFMLENFFKGNPGRILRWFSNFSGTSGSEHRKGAKALSQFAFINRDICWEELEWKGKHGQSPAMVATKPHYFIDLDVQRTVENFLEYVPEFWSSGLFADSLKDGEILRIDTKFFVNMFLDLMYKEESEEVWDVIEQFLSEEPFSVLCDHLLIVLEEKDLSFFLDLMCKFLKPKWETAECASPTVWLEVILSECGVGISIDQILLLNAVTSQARQLLRLVREESDEKSKEKVKNIVSQIFALSSPDSFAPVMKECSEKKNIESIKLLGLQSWAIHFKLSEEILTPESWESLFSINFIGFKKSNKYRLLDDDDDESLEDSGCEGDVRPSGRLKSKKKGRKRKRHRRDLKLDSGYGDKFLDLELDNNLDLQSKAGDWMLSTDQYSTTWNSVDLPEHISKYCFMTWMKWVFSRK